MYKFKKMCLVSKLSYASKSWSFVLVNEGLLKKIGINISIRLKIQEGLVSSMISDAYFVMSLALPPDLYIRWQFCMNYFKGLYVGEDVLNLGANQTEYFTQSVNILRGMKPGWEHNEVILNP